MRRIEAGYVQGYNRYLASVGGAQGVPDPTCRGRAWVRPITVQDSYLRFYQLMLNSGERYRHRRHRGGRTAVGADCRIEPGKAAVAALTIRGGSRASSRPGCAANPGQLGSNAVAIGSAGTRNHHGLLLGNPHFPWIGTERFYQAQLTIPGQINVSGASLYGVPLIMIGHTATVAWSHTVSTAGRITLYQLTVVPGHPTNTARRPHRWR